MKLRLIFKNLAIVIAVILFYFISPAALAAGNQNNQNQGNQALTQPAMLIAPDLDAKINVYPKPTQNLQRIGYGLGGDRVTVLEQISTNEGYTWNHVRFDAPPNTEGWVQGNFISFMDAEDRFNGGDQRQNSGQGEVYLGSQQHSTPNNQRPNYQQRQN
jgi:hypothetical protein